MKFLFCFILLFILICLLFYTNPKIYEKYQNDPCQESNTVTSIRSCYKEYLKGKQNYIDNVEKQCNDVVSENTMQIENLKKSMRILNEETDSYKTNLNESVYTIRKNQNDMIIKVNNTTDILQKGNNAKKKIDAESKLYK